MIANFLEMLQNVVFDLLGGIFSYLPQMPFDLDSLEQQISDNILYKVLQWMNYFIPIDQCLLILALWSTAMMAYIGMKLAIKYSGKFV